MCRLLSGILRIEIHLERLLFWSFDPKQWVRLYWEESHDHLLHSPCILSSQDVPFAFLLSSQLLKFRWGKQACRQTDWIRLLPSTKALRHEPSWLVWSEVDAGFHSKPHLGERERGNVPHAKKGVVKRRQFAIKIFELHFPSSDTQSLISYSNLSSSLLSFNYRDFYCGNPFQTFFFFEFLERCVKHWQFHCLSFASECRRIENLLKLSSRGSRKQGRFRKRRNRSVGRVG